jgi:integrase
MRDESLLKFEEWWHSRSHKRKRIKGLKLSDKTLVCYKNILYKMPDIEVTTGTNVDKTIMFLRKWLEDNVGVDKIFKTNYPQMTFALRTYLKMYEDDPDPKINRKAKTIRVQIKNVLTQDVKGTQKFFIFKVLSKTQIRKIIELIPDELPHKMDRDIFVLLLSLLYETGCRIDEICNIKKSDINFEERSIDVFGKGQYFRRVSFELDVKDMLHERCVFISEKDYIFSWKTQTVKNYFKAIIRIMYSKHKKELWENFTKISPHWFRHSRATHLAVIWNDIIKIKDYMGWSDIKMAEVYIENANILPAEIRKYHSLLLWED